MKNQTLTFHTTNPTIVEIGIEYYLPTDGNWIPNGFQLIDAIVDSDELNDDLYDVCNEIAEIWCNSQGCAFSQILMA